MPCLYPHCTCINECSYVGGSIPDRDPKKPLFDRELLKELAERYELAVEFGSQDFHLSFEDMKAIAFSLRFTAMRL